MADHTLEGFVKGMSMEERATRVVASIEMNRVLARDWSHEKDSAERNSSGILP